MPTVKVTSFLGLLALALVACGPSQVDTGIKFVDPDGAMGSANGLFFDMGPVDDRLNAGGGDSQDWRYIIVPKPGRITLQVNIDDPNMPGIWYLHDPEGRVVHQQTLNPAQGYYELRGQPVIPGQYYFQILAQGGGSPYTVGATFEADPEPVVVAEPEPDPDPEPEEVPKKRNDKKKTDDKKKDDKKKTDDKTPDAGAVATGNTKVVGTITLVTPKDDGSAEIVIRGVGDSNGVTVGMKGKVEGLSVTVTTTKCFTTKCEATVTGANARDMRENGKVSFMVP